MFAKKNNLELSVKDPVCFVIVVVYHTCVKLCMYTIMLIKQVSNIKEYVKYVLQIFVHIKCNN
jgi:hypothetical protein